METYKSLQAQLAKLESEKIRIAESGQCLKGVRLEKAAAGGSASKKMQQTYKYGRLRCGKGGTLPNGAKSRYIPLAEIGQCEAAIARGKELTKIEKEITALRTKLEKLKMRAAAIGLEIPG